MQLEPFSPIITLLGLTIATHRKPFSLLPTQLIPSEVNVLDFGGQPTSLKRTLVAFFVPLPFEVSVSTCWFIFDLEITFQDSKPSLYLKSRISDSRVRFLRVRR